MSDLTKNSLLVKSVSAGVFAGVVDKFVRGSPDSTPSMIFGASVGTGILATSMITSYIPSMSENGMSTGMVSRGLEIAATTGGTYLLYTKGGQMLFPNVRKPDFDMKTVGIVVAADLFGEFAKGWVLGNTSFFN